MEQRLIDKGVDEGIMKEKFRMAKIMLAAGHNAEFIKEFTELDIKQIDVLRGKNIL